MTQTKNADGFLHQRFCVPFTRRQAFPALQRLTRNAVALPAAGLYPHFIALHAACCFTRPQALKPFERCEATLERCVAALNS